MLRYVAKTGHLFGWSNFEISRLSFRKISATFNTLLKAEISDIGVLIFACFFKLIRTLSDYYGYGGFGGYDYFGGYGGGFNYGGWGGYAGAPGGGKMRGGGARGAKRGGAPY